MVDRMLVNAAIEKLVSGEEEGWLEAARIVVEFGQKIGTSQRVVTHNKLTREDRDPHIVSGYAANIGSASIDDRQQSTQHSVSGAIIERVGYYKVVRIAHWSCIQWTHYRDDYEWQNREQLKTWVPKKYFLFYNTDGEPYSVALAIMTKVTPPLWILWKHQAMVFLEYLKLLLGGKIQKIEITHNFMRFEPRHFEIIQSTRHQRGQVVHWSEI